MVFRLGSRYTLRNWPVGTAEPMFVWQQVRLLGLARQARLELLEEILGSLAQAVAERLEGFDELLEDDSRVASEYVEPTYLRLPPDDIIRVTSE